MRLSRVLLALCATAITAASLAAQGAPAKGWRADFLALWKEDQSKYVQLVNATPWEKFSWRPAKGVRSVCEVFLHIGADNYVLGKELGAQLPAGFNEKTAENCPGDKAAVLKMLNGGFDAFTAALTKLSDADGDKEVKVFGQTFSYRGFAMMNLGHAGEHLGQSIAYARMNGITPPWSK